SFLFARRAEQPPLDGPAVSAENAALGVESLADRIEAAMFPLNVAKSAKFSERVLLLARQPAGAFLVASIEQHPVNCGDAGDARPRQMHKELPVLPSEPGGRVESHVP